MTNPSCPNCGAELAPTTHSFAPDVAPWICNKCLQGWFPSELTDQARALWRPTHRDFGFDQDRVSIEIAVGGDRQAAAQRGVNTLPDQVPLLQEGHVEQIASMALPDTPEAEAFKALLSPS
jgi:hypothetical protein